jgi:hypothetical protein
VSSRATALVLASALVAMAGAPLACGDEITLGTAVTPDGGAPGAGDGSSPNFDHDAEVDLPELTGGCAGKACGHGCLPCPDGESCERPPVFHVCSDTHTCLPERPACIGIAGSGEGDPNFEACAGLSCGDACEPCHQDDFDCTRGRDGRCRSDGTCVLASEAGVCP